MKQNYRKEMSDNIKLIGENLFIDPEGKNIGHKYVPHWNTTLLTLSYALDQNPLIIGEPGFAKTTAAKVIGSVLSGYPFDLYEAAQIQGHPDQTFETMLARPDFSKLSKEESVIWLVSAYLPLRIIDELNRLPGGNQDEILNMLETGRISYLNSTFYTGKTPFIATANNPDDGNHILIPPIKDRFAINVEVGHLGATYEEAIECAERNINELKRSELTDKILSIINDKEKSIENRLKSIDSARKEYAAWIESDKIGGHVLDPEKKQAMQQEIYSVELDENANVFLQMLDSELNYTPTNGRKRSNDPVDRSNHATKLASTKAKNAMSPRGIIRGIKRYAQALAYLNNDEKATKDYIVAMIPHALGHRLDFTDDFRSTHESTQRGGEYGMTREMHLATKLGEGVEDNFKNVKKSLDLLVTAFKDHASLSKAQKQEVEEMLANTDKLDHPLLKEYAKRISESRKGR